MGGQQCRKLLFPTHESPSPQRTLRPSQLPAPPYPTEIAQTATPPNPKVSEFIITPIPLPEAPTLGVSHLWHNIRRQAFAAAKPPQRHRREFRPHSNPRNLEQ